MSEPSLPYLAVLKVSYDYDPQSDDEIAVKEDQIVFLLERTDDDWWKVKVKNADDNGPAGLIPAAYVEQAEHSSVVKALYDYEATAPGELTIKEDEILLAFDAEDDWLLVQSSEDGGKVGLVPANYVEPHSEEEEAAPAAAQIVPPPVTSVYVDPAERVSHNKVNSVDDIKTWSISELDKKGKKTKGTLGIGNGAVFFASESSKAAVQKWQTIDITNISVEKSKHVHFDVSGATPISLHFHAGSKDNAEAIVQKLQSSRALSLEAASPAPASEPQPSASPAKPPQIDVTKKASVHFSPASPQIIPPRSPSPEEEEGEEEEEEEEYSTPHGADGEMAVALYDFKADGDDELTVSEGDQLVVIEKDGDEWWKCRNVHGQEGMVPAQYVEINASSAARSSATQVQEEEEEDDTAAVTAQAEAAAAEERARAEADAKAAAEAERARAAAEERKQKEKRKQEAAKSAAAAEAERTRRQEAAANRAQSTPPPQSRPPRPSSEGSGSKKDRPSSAAGSARLNENGRPPADRVRTWHDRTGQFRVEAALLTYKDGKLRLHKTNGVIVEVPSEKMSAEDMKYVEKLMAKKSKPVDDDNVPLATLQRSQSKARPSQQPKKGPTVDWFDFFLNAGCDLDDCTRYAASFERDKIDEAILPDITESTMRSLGLREGDIIRVNKAIQQRKPQSSPDKRQEQIARDEEYAKQLQAQESAGSSSRGPTNLFTNGPDGSLKPGRRGRPTPSKSLPANVDLNALGAASEIMQRTASPQLLSPDTTRPSSASPVQPPPRSSSAAPVVSGFGDDAWANRPSSTKPLTPTPAANVARAPSAPPASTPAAAPEVQAPAPSLAPPAPASAPVTATPTPPATTGPPSLAKTTQDDIFDQLARLEQLRKTAPAQLPQQPPPPVQSPPVATSTPPVASPPPGFASGMGMVNSPFSMGQHLQNQQTGAYNGPRGPFAPVPANHALLQPLIPTQTGFGGFVATRPSSTPSQPTFLNSQPTGFPGQQPLTSQPTGFPGMQQPMMSQPTGMPFGGGMNGMNGGMNTINPFGSGSSFSPVTPVMSNPTGFNPGFGQFNSGISSPPPVPPLPSNANNTNNNSANPANIFAQMKSGTFATENDNSAPQGADKYNALRPQPTGWGTFGQGPYVGGY
ncbi:hypothetical protein D9758_001079 [Tetrapyrgos nigripes]|uniref:Actin cytoskeleton-regulatory complex protein SLA1 n=1 Tax=Tetrapyrgos nigripes TaxID=182062 RepID=A0A8H5LUH5_9AGAR|nr:hypothetical protein D9758_001079 [Tetrapyrgos nigripes]